MFFLAARRRWNAPRGRWMRRVPDGVMAAHGPLEARVLVQIQVGQPKSPRRSNRGNTKYFSRTRNARPHGRTHQNLFGEREPPAGGARGGARRDSVEFVRGGEVPGRGDFGPVHGNGAGPRRVFDPADGRRRPERGLDGAADHGGRGEEGVGPRGDGGFAVLRLRAPGPQGPQPDADHGEVDGEPFDGGRGGPGADDGFARAADPGVFRHSGGPPLRGAGAGGAFEPGAGEGEPGGGGAGSGRAQERLLLFAAAGGGAGAGRQAADESHGGGGAGPGGRREGEGLHFDGRHDEHGGDAVRGGAALRGGRGEEHPGGGEPLHVERSGGVAPEGVADRGHNGRDPRGRGGRRLHDRRSSPHLRTRTRRQGC